MIEKKEVIDFNILNEIDNIKVPDDIFDVPSAIKKGKKIKLRRKIVKATICFTIIFMCLSTFVILNNRNDNVIINEIANQDITDETIEIHLKIKSLSFDKITEAVCLIKVEEEGECKIINNIPSTKVKVKILKDYKNNLNDEIEIWVPGGTFKYSEIKEFIKNDVPSNIRNDSNIRLDYGFERNKDKTYLASIYKLNEDYVVCKGLKYSYGEYDEEDGTIINEAGIKMDTDNLDEFIEKIGK